MRVLAIGLGVLATTASCVTRDAYLAVEDRNKEIEDRLSRVERSNESFRSERIELIAHVDDLTVKNKTLSGELSSVRGERERLASSLAEHQDQLAARTHEMESLRSTYDGLVGDLEAEVSSGQMEIQKLRDGFEVNVSDQFLFDKGRAALKPAGREVLRRIAEKFSDVAGRIEVIGHTDNSPIRGKLVQKFPTNWELGAGRAASVVRFFEKLGVPPARLSAISRGSGSPRAPNDSGENRARNRRIEIRVIPDSGEDWVEDFSVGQPTSDTGH